MARLRAALRVGAYRLAGARVDREPPPVLIAAGFHVLGLAHEGEAVRLDHRSRVRVRTPGKGSGATGDLRGRMYRTCRSLVVLVTTGRSRSPASASQATTATGVSGGGRTYRLIARAYGIRVSHVIFAKGVVAVGGVP